MKKIILSSLLISVFILDCFSQKIDYSKFKGKKVKINQIVQLNEPFIYDYEINSFKGKDSLVYNTYSKPRIEKTLTDRYKTLFQLNTAKKKNNFLKLKCKLTFKQGEDLISLIKYQESKDSIVSKSKIIIIRNNGSEIDTKIKSFIPIEYIFKNLTIKSFWEFYNSENNANYPEINKLKPQVQDANGVLNIEKLAQVIKENKSSLSKYLDE